MNTTKLLPDAAGFISSLGCCGNVRSSSANDPKGSDYCCYGITLSRYRILPGANGFAALCGHGNRIRLLGESPSLVNGCLLSAHLSQLALDLWELPLCVGSRKQGWAN